MAKTTYKVGDKVRILKAKKIQFGERYWNDGDISEIKRLLDDGRPCLSRNTKELDDRGLPLWSTELQYIEKVEESDAKMTQFKVGDKVRVINANASEHSNGDEGEVVSITPIWGVVFIDVEVDGVQQGHYAEDIELVSPKQTKNQRLTSAEQAISTLEQKVEAMQAEIDALKAAQKSADIAKIAEGLAKMVGKKMELTPNEQRKAIIDEAKAFVEDVQKRDYRVRSTPAITSFQKSVFFGQTDELVFHVNAEKRTVVAIIRTIRGKHVVHKAIAKCNPSDVFNADIGKAIALGRALGLDVERFEKAVQPSEVVAGMHVDTYYIGSDEKNETCPTFVTHVLNGMPAFGNGTHSSVFKITDDTEAQY